MSAPSTRLLNRTSCGELSPSASKTPSHRTSPGPGTSGSSTAGQAPRTVDVLHRPHLLQGHRSPHPDEVTAVAPSAAAGYRRFVGVTLFLVEVGAGLIAQREDVDEQ